MTDENNLLIFGMGYSACVFAKRMMDRGWRVSGTARSGSGRVRIKELNATAIHFDSDEAVISDDLKSAIANATHILISAGPDAAGDPVLNRAREALVNADQVGWIGYLSTVGVYGDHDGAWVDETSQCRPVSKRSLYRVAAEREWALFARETGKRLQIFRLGGIYGPGSNPLEKLRAGRSRRIDKPGQVFSRIHVDDIASALEAAVTRKSDHLIFNVVDSEPAPPQDVIAYGAKLLNMEPPPLVPFDEADMTEMARSFYGENKRVSNARLREDLCVTLTYPTYREGLKSLVETVG